MKTLRSVFLTVSLLLGICSTATHADVAYTLTDLGTGIESDVIPHSLNDQGQVVGYLIPTNGSPFYHGFLYNNNTRTDLGTLGGTYSSAEGINASGQIIGGADTPSHYHPFLYSNGVMTDLGTLGGNFGYAASINATGQIVGSADVDQTHSHAFLYNNGVMTDLGTFGGRFSYATTINASGQVVGNADLDDTHTHAFLYQNGVKTDLGTFGGSNSFADSINASGQVVGYADTSTIYPHAFLYSNGTMADLGTLGDTTVGNFVSSQAHGINDSGQIVGLSADHNLFSHAFLYSNGVMTDLNTLIDPSLHWELYDATAINSNGQIIAKSVGNHGFLLTPNVTIATAPMTAPKVVATPIQDTSIYVTWTPIAGATRYSVYRGTAAGQFHTYIGTVSNATMFNDTTVKSLTSYYYIVTAVNTLGEGPKSNEASAYISIAQPLSNLTGTAVDQTTIDLNWTASSDGIIYNVFRSDVSYTFHRWIGSTTSTHYRDTYLTPGKTYYYIVRPASASAVGPKSIEVAVTTKSPIVISSVSFSPSSVKVGLTTTGVLVLSEAAPVANATVQLTSSNPSALYVPPTAQITAGFTYRSFTATARPVTVSTPVTVTATYGGVSKTTIVTVNP